jgi:hypothetical protein
MMARRDHGTFQKMRGKPAGEASNLKVLFVHMQAGELIHPTDLSECDHCVQAIQPHGCVASTANCPDTDGQESSVCKFMSK